MNHHWRLYTYNQMSPCKVRVLTGVIMFIVNVHRDKIKIYSVVLCRFIPKAKYDTVKLFTNWSDPYSLHDIYITSSHHIVEWHIHGQSTSNENLPHVICSTDITPIYLHKWEALSYKHVPVYTEMVEGSTLETCMKADRQWRCVRGTPNTRFR